MRDGFATDGGGPVVFKAAPLLLRRGRHECRPHGVSVASMTPASSRTTRSLKSSTSLRADCADSSFTDSSFAHSAFLTAIFTNGRCLTREHGFAAADIRILEMQP